MCVQNGSLDDIGDPTLHYECPYERKYCAGPVSDLAVLSYSARGTDIGQLSESDRLVSVSLLALPDIGGGRHVRANCLRG